MPPGQPHGPRRAPECRVTSYGVLQGPPPGGDGLTLDATVLRNPAAVRRLKYLSGRDPEARDYVLDGPGSGELVVRAVRDALALLPGARERGECLNLFVRCLSGRHRSVAISDAIGARLEEAGVAVQVVHRDIDKAVLEASAVPAPPGP